MLHFHPNPKLLCIIFTPSVNVWYIIPILLTPTLSLSWLPAFHHPNLSPLHAISTHFPPRSLHYSSHTFTLILAQADPKQYYFNPLKTHNYTSSSLPHDIVYPQCVIPPSNRTTIFPPLSTDAWSASTASVDIGLDSLDLGSGFQFSGL